MGEKTSNGRLHTYLDVHVFPVTCVFCVLGDSEGLVFYTLGPHRHFLHFLRHGGPAAGRLDGQLPPWPCPLLPGGSGWGWGHRPRAPWV